MLKENQYVKMKWNNSNKKHYISKGYKFTKINDEFIVKAEDLSLHSKFKVLCYCDYCGKEYSQSFSEHIKSGDCCKKCTYTKAHQTIKDRYGVDNIMDIDGVKEKQVQTNLEKYGVLHPMQNSKVREKSEKTCLEKYGNNTYFGSQIGKQAVQKYRDGLSEQEKQEIMDKIRTTCKERYGTKYPCELEEFKEKIRETNMKKYGVPYGLMNEDVRCKIIQSLIQNQNNRKSKQEQKCFEIIHKLYPNAISSKRCGKYTLDCILNCKNDNIDIEYDGWYWHKNMQEHDDIRNKFLISKGYKIIRILSEGRMPTEQQIQNAINDIITNKKEIAYIDIRSSQ